ncbi:GntR family transcriptional regulator [Lentilactobacillus buchneri]|uniref:HTH gntR-type domain-containing protein n=1 Tax=Lentilactobacillus buchneri DSM 20057 TaxID=1423728 RepID=A0A4R5NLQ2_LENBU|nr:GntR family transcriptional regulator [Lentilactobacillus buchneri]WCJ50925.1 GntR family transcriptional regulator [Lentilactobacillus sp. Egmn17]AEB74521.1 transcriptional regulator, GntR family [Lentilactobacillus buchneri NRRL B-30929]KRK67665.1 GntR family transcriptional regulator [Lentilactobacillus buchneri DSM 20057]MCT2882962.1 GntR family transcriptional regulator [Lentilactobacillus buchneri]MCT2899228.1 GntR family transcriptional regulator [Lentilactobacillus buchneri]
MKFDDKIPIYYQIKNYIYRQIIVGELAPGDKLPAVRQLAVDLTVNVNTVQRALGELISEKIIEPQRGKGNFVTEDRETIEKLKKLLITEQLQDLYENLRKLNVSDEEIVDYLQDYINKRKQVQS